MRANAFGLAGLALMLVAARSPAAVLFEDKFKTGLSDAWQAVGLIKADYRVRNSGLERRVPFPHA